MDFVSNVPEKDRFGAMATISLRMGSWLKISSLAKAFCPEGIKNVFEIDSI